MEHAVVSLEALGIDWPKLVRFVERSGLPLWLEADGEIRGVLLPAREARRLMGGCVARGETPGTAPDSNEAALAPGTPAGCVTTEES
ncbi:MAG TPA: hypothetical protein VLA19_25290 [Herpetosiphonaceae bacterium]|nr:hypothetical protein [Herpetosiphonaceae bacterium]